MMSLHSRFGTVPAISHVVSTKAPREHTAGAGTSGVSHVSTRGLQSVWHVTSRGAWSMSEGLAAVYTGLLVARHSLRTSVEIIAPSTAQAMLTSSLLSDFGASMIDVSVAPVRRSASSPPLTLVTSLPPDEQDESGYVEMLRELLKHDMRPSQDAVISIGQRPLLGDPSGALATEVAPATERVPLLQQFSDRGDLIKRLLSLSPEATQQVLPLHTSGDVDNIGQLMGHGDWSDDKVICLCDTALPPIAASLAQSLVDNEADVLTNSPRLVSEQAATSRALRTMHDFADEAVMCTSRHWVLIEPKLGRGGSHRNATLLMRSISTARFIMDVALGLLDGQTAVVVPQQKGVPEEAEDISKQREEPAEGATETAVLSLRSRTTDGTARKTRCRRYSDLHAKKLREVLARMTPEEISTLLTCLESSQSE